MSTLEVAEKLVALCREGKNIDAINELYDDHIVSIEPKGAQVESTTGKQAALEKTINWHNMVQQIHSGIISEPIVMGNFFTVSMDMDVTYKDYGRMSMQELAVYEVKNGKIVYEQFFYNMQG